MNSDGSSTGAPCRFCGRRPSPGQHRVSGPQGPLCTDCIETGLRLTAARKPDPVQNNDVLHKLQAADDAACELCDRTVRLSFLGFRRPLARVASARSGAVICAGCLDWAGDIINRAIRG